MWINLPAMQIKHPWNYIYEEYHLILLYPEVFKGASFVGDLGLWLFKKRSVLIRKLWKYQLLSRGKEEHKDWLLSHSCLKTDEIITEKEVFTPRYKFCAAWLLKLEGTQIWIPRDLIKMQILSLWVWVVPGTSAFLTSPRWEQCCCYTHQSLEQGHKGLWAKSQRSMVQYGFPEPSTFPSWWSQPTSNLCPWNTRFITTDHHLWYYKSSRLCPQIQGAKS